MARSLSLIGFALVLCTFSRLSLSVEAVDENAPLDLFHVGDKDNDDSLTMPECGDMWLTLDVDGDRQLNKVEFIFKWTFANYPDSEKAPLYMRLVDNDFNGYISKDEIDKLCLFWDDDENQEVTLQEFLLNWKAMFRA